MTKKANLYKEEEKKKMKNKVVPVNRHSLKGKRSVKPSKQTKEMGVETGKRATKPADQREAVNVDKGKRPMKPSEQTIVLNVDKEKRSPKPYVQTQVVNVDKEKGSPKPYELTQVVNVDKRKRTSVQAKVVDGDKEKISAKPSEQIQVVNVDKRKRTSVQTKVVDGDKGKTPVKPFEQTIVLDVVKGKRFVKPSEQTRSVNVDKRKRPVKPFEQTIVVDVDKDFSTRSPFIQGNGNFGSIDADPVASMRYTECRLEALTKAVLLADLEQKMLVLEAEDSSSQPPAGSPQPPVGGKIPVTFDIYGSPVGPESNKFTSFVCQCVMTHITITYERWKLVPKGLKDRLWEAITDIYEIPSCWRKKILSHANISWKDLKARLRESKIHNQTRPLEEIKKDNPPNIRAEDWVLFVDQAFTSKALKKRTQAKEARSKKISLHRTGRAGAASQPQGSAPQPPAGGKKSVTFDIFGSPVGPGSTKFTSFVGQCARTHIRITYEAWKLVPEGLKDRLWEAITDIYEVPSCWRKKILSCANISWRDRKAKLRDSKIYKHTRPLEEIKKDKPPNVRAKDWALFVDQAFTPKALKKRTQAREARAKNFALHRTGRTGAARIRYKMEQENPGKKIKRTELFVGIHTSQNGTCLNEEFGRKLDRVREITENNPSSTSLDIDHDPVADVFGKDSRGRVRGYGTSVSRRILKGTKPMIDQLGSQNKSHPPVEKRIRDIVMDVIRTEFNHLLDLHTPVSNASQVRPVNEQNHTSSNVTQAWPVNEQNHTSRNVTQVQPVNEQNHASRNVTLVRPVNEHNHTSRIVTQVRPVNEQNHTYRNVTQVCPVNEQNHTSRNVTQVRPVNEQNHTSRNVTGLQPVNEQNHTSRNVTGLQPVNEQNHTSRNVTGLQSVNEQTHTSRNVTGLQPVNEQNHTSRNVTGLQPVNEQTYTSRNVTQVRPVNEQNHTSRNVTQVQPVNEQIQTSRNVIEDVDLLDLAGTAVAIGRATLPACGVGPYMCDVIIDKVLEPTTPIALDPAKRTMSQVDVGDIIKWPTVLLAKHCV